MEKKFDINDYFEDKLVEQELISYKLLRNQKDMAKKMLSGIEDFIDGDVSSLMSIRTQLKDYIKRAEAVL